MKRKVDLQTLSDNPKENSHPTRSIYLPFINVGNSGHRKVIPISKKGNVKEHLKQSTDIVIERKATKKCQATQTDMFENDKNDEDYDYVYR